LLHRATDLGRLFTRTSGSRGAHQFGALLRNPGQREKLAQALKKAGL